MSAARDRLLLIGSALVIAAGMSGGCATPRPHVEPELPPLNAPPPPPRLLPPLAGGPIEGAAAPPPPETGPTPQPARRRSEAPRPPERQETKPTDAQRPEEPAQAEEAAPLAPAPVLQLAPTTESNASEETIRQQLARATKDLSHVDYVALSADAKVQYDTAKRFMVLSDQAIKDRNFVFARTLADKAAVIAAVLSSR